MTDIFQEVEEDLRRERLKRVWDKYGVYVILTAVLIVALTAGWRGYEAWSTNRARAAGDAFYEALAQAEASGSATSGQTLLQFADGAPSGYAMLARFRAATEFANAGEDERAAQTLRELATDGSVREIYQDLASVRLAHVLLDAGDPEAARLAAGPIAEDTSNPFHNSAQELMGLAAYSAGDLTEARRWFTALEDAVGTPADLRQRATLMLALITQSAGAGSDGPAEGEPAAEETN